MTNLKISSKMHLFIIISSLVVAIGLVVGLVFQFISDGYFNYGQEYTDYNSIVVDYAFIDYGEEGTVKEICEKAFDDAGISYYASTYGTTSDGGEFTFSFAKSVSLEKVTAASNAIHAKLTDAQLSQLSRAYVHEVETQVNGCNPLTYCAIAVASGIVLHFLYFIIRYSLTMAFAAILADVHNLAIYVSLLAITRLPVGSSAMVFATLTVLLTIIGTCLLFDRVRKNNKKENLAKLSANELVDLSAGASVCNVVSASVFVAAAAVIVLVLMSISALSVSLVISPVICAIFCAASAVYGTLFFSPSVYSRFKTLGDNFKAKRKAAKKS